ncbi:hypothetical protein Tcan_17904 [Toxocara canis]|uniref:Uncharacterized protein n=1 Tax=Toxocara canis TaxID=6265 RepID=A0A0B2W2A8_TOXCA|nr:hypothetical protein Tcan_17904 [Toxocara canis]
MVDSGTGNMNANQRFMFPHVIMEGRQVDSRSNAIRGSATSVESCVVRYGAVLHRQEKRLTADGGRGKEAVRLRHRAEKCRHSSVRQLSFWGHLIRAVMPVMLVAHYCYSVHNSDNHQTDVILYNLFAVCFVDYVIGRITKPKEAHSFMTVVTDFVSLQPKSL